MKKITYILFLLALYSSQLLVSCKDYLEVPVEAAKTEEDIFSDFYNFQGFVSTIYGYIPYRITKQNNPGVGGELICAEAGALNFIYGDYLKATSNRKLYYCHDSDLSNVAIWKDGWAAIRIANLGIEHLDLLEGTEDEKNQIEGQLYFLRAWFHLQLLEPWGAIPYIDHVLTDDFDQPRYYEYNGKWGYQATSERIAEDFERAAKLLPDYWEIPSTDYGRATSLAAFAYQAKTLLYAGSPLASRYSHSGQTIATGAEDVVDKKYMERAAVAAAKAIAIADKNPDQYGLMPWDEYSESFYSSDKSVISSKETVFTPINNYKGKYTITGLLGTNYIPDPTTFGGAGKVWTVTQNYVDKFEMADGSLYKEEYDNDNSKRWDMRDPRFRKAIYVDRDKQGKKESTRFHLYSGGKTRVAKNNDVQTPYIVHKFWADKANFQDKGSEFKNNTFSCPYMRLAEVYLMYAEAVNEWKGDANQAAGNLSISAIDAVNIIRQRAGHVVASSDGGAYHSFRELVLNERAVELCFEGAYAQDIRRWQKGREVNNTPVYDLKFDKDWTQFTRVKLTTRIYETPRHDLFPFPRSLTLMYDDFPQNEGWN